LTRIETLRKEKELLGFYLTGHPLDDVKHMLQRLSCVSLKQFEQLDKGAVCRAGFVVESVSTRIASKSGRKFAILTIGDHDHRYELPIWPELFEEKGHLLLENQLLYAVLQIDRDEDGVVRLQCRWLDDLSKVDEEMCRQCDEAYDKARMQVKMQALRKNRPKKEVASPKKAKKEEEPMRTLVSRKFFATTMENRRSSCALSQRRKR
jgi:DNA polymerase-3 subunit alpha